MEELVPVQGIPQQILDARAETLANLPRICVSEIKSREALIRRVEDTALHLSDIVKARREAGDPHWWESQDMLDDMQDILDFVRKDDIK